MIKFLMWIGLMAGLASFNLNASLVYGGLQTFGGAGLGTVPTILTFQASGTESGCVASMGGSDVIGSAACPVGSGITGGDEKKGASQTQTQPISAAIAAEG